MPIIIEGDDARQSWTRADADEQEDTPDGRTVDYWCIDTGILRSKLGESWEHGVWILLGLKLVGECPEHYLRYGRRRFVYDPRPSLIPQPVKSGW